MKRPTHGDGHSAACHLEPLGCETCGTALEIRCPNGCEGGVPVRRPAPTAATKAAVRGTAHGTTQARIYQPKPCAGCQATFQPTGPRALYCPACRRSGA